MDLNQAASAATQTLNYLLTSISADLDHSVSSTVDESINAITLIISAPTEQLGQIIGKEGKIIKSLRTIISLAYPTFRINLQINN